MMNLLKFFNKKVSAFSLVEILLAISLFSLSSATVVYFAVDTLRTTQNSGYKVSANLLSQEIYNALLSNRNETWPLVVSATGQGPMHLTFSQNKYNWVAGVETQNGITASFEVQNAYRDANGNLSTTGTNNDLHFRLIIISINWTDLLNQQINNTWQYYLSDWNTQDWTQTTDTDFNAGSKNQTKVVNNTGGEVELQSLVYADWCKPALTLTEQDLTGQGVAKSIFALPGKLYMGTGNNASGYTFIAASVNPSDPPVVTNLGTFNGYKGNAVAGVGNYAFVVSDTYSVEVIILNISATSYTKIGWFNIPGNGDGATLSVSSTVGYVTSGSKLYSFDISSKTGSRSQLNSLNLSATAVKTKLVGNYLYIAENSTTKPLEIVNVTNPSSMSIAASSTFNNGGGVSVTVNSDGSRAYLTTANSATYSEFFIIDTSTKSGNNPVLGSYNSTSGMLPADVTVPTSDRAIIAGNNGTEQYTVLNITTESTPVRCGGLQLTSGVNSLASVLESNNNAYSYVLTSDSTKELKIIRGGAGGGSSDTGFGYTPTGDYTSQILDTTSTVSRYFFASSTAAIPGATSLQYQIRTSNNSNMSGASWQGPDGTASSYFTLNQIQTTASQLNNNRYLQFKFFFTSDTISTPQLKDFTINYQKA